MIRNRRILVWIFVLATLLTMTMAPKTKQDKDEGKKIQEKDQMTIKTKKVNEKDQVIRIQMGR